MKHDTLNVNFACYEDAKEYLGMTEATLPDIEFMSETISGAGIGGEMEEVLAGMVSAMTTTLNFRTANKSAMKLTAPKIHNIDLRVAQQQRDSSSGKIKIVQIKHVLKLMPKKQGMGTVAPASPGDVSGDYATSYFATYIDGEKKSEIDPANFICNVNGKDYLADVRKALGK